MNPSKAVRRAAMAFRRITITAIICRADKPMPAIRYSIRMPLGQHMKHLARLKWKRRIRYIPKAYLLL